MFNFIKYTQLLVTYLHKKFLSVLDMCELNERITALESSVVDNKNKLIASSKIYVLSNSDITLSQCQSVVLDSVVYVPATRTFNNVVTIPTDGSVTGEILFYAKGTNTASGRYRSKIITAFADGSTELIIDIPNSITRLVYFDGKWFVK